MDKAEAMLYDKFVLILCSSLFKTFDAVALNSTNLFPTYGNRNSVLSPSVSIIRCATCSATAFAAT